ncbi:MAG: radical SAM protein [archaeon]|jgi:MoaA/NifB/PqqE/SkfB family radical SAM enzyme
MIKYNKIKDSYKFNEKNVNFFINIGFIITNNCMNKCLFCCDPQKEAEVFSLKDSKKYLSALAKRGLKKLCITGGEPLLNKHVYKIAKCAHDLGLNVTLATNGFILTKEKLLKLKSNIDNIRFSILGSEKTHDKITGNSGSYQKVLQGIDLAKKLKTPVTIVSTIFADNLSDLPSIARLCEKKGVEKLYIFSLMYKGKAKEIHKEQHVPAQKINKILTKIKKIGKQEKWNLGITLINWDIEGQCVLLYPNGDLFASPSHKDVGEAKLLGNLKHDSAQKMWDNYPFKESYLMYYKAH